MISMLNKLHKHTMESMNTHTRHAFCNPNYLTVRITGGRLGERWPTFILDYCRTVPFIITRKWKVEWEKYYTFGLNSNGCIARHYIWTMKVTKIEYIVLWDEDVHALIRMSCNGIMFLCKLNSAKKGHKECIMSNEGMKEITRAVVRIDLLPSICINKTL